MALLCLLLYGSFVMPLRRGVPGPSDTAAFSVDDRKFSWHNLVALGCHSVISLLTANTLLCSIESVLKKKSARQWLLVISPQVTHIGFLFILLAHLLSGYGSFRGTAVVYENQGLKLPNGNSVVLKKINVVMDRTGYINDWTSDVEYFNGSRSLGTDRIGPNNPSFKDGLGIYIKNIEIQPYPVAMVEVSRDPGAVWALVGGILFMAGMTTLLVFKIKKEEANL